MKFIKTTLRDCYVIELEEKADHRGFFARVLCANEMAAQGLENKFVQVNMSLSKKAGTIRGFHYQIPPFGEVKVVRCVRGRLLDTVIDLRPDSPSYHKHFQVELSGENRKMIYVPLGCAHGFQTLENDTEAHYFSSQFYSQEHERGIRWNDRFFKIEWPIREKATISEKDSAFPDYRA